MTSKDESTSEDETTDIEQTPQCGELSNATNQHNEREECILPEGHDNQHRSLHFRWGDEPDSEKLDPDEDIDFDDIEQLDDKSDEELAQEAFENMDDDDVIDAKNPNDQGGDQPPKKKTMTREPATEESLDTSGVEEALNKTVQDAAEEMYKHVDQQLIRDIARGIAEELGEVMDGTTHTNVERTYRPHSISFRLGWGTGHKVKMYYEDVEDLDDQLTELNNAEDIMAKIENIKERTSKERD